jgi:hypothetical protein
MRHRFAPLLVLLMLAGVLQGCSTGIHTSLKAAAEQMLTGLGLTEAYRIALSQFTLPSE